MKRSKFSLSHYKLLTGVMGALIPICDYEVLPGDSIRQSTSLLIRMTPLVAPVMHPVRIRVHSFFVPYRLIWEDWENFITGGEDGTYTAVPPYATAVQNHNSSTLGDYLGIPPGDYTGLDIDFSRLPVRAYNLIWNEMYRDADLQDAVEISLASGEDTTTPGTLKNVCWEKDYFTTARPWTSKGDEIFIPLGDTAPVIPDPEGAYPTWSYSSSGNRGLNMQSGSSTVIWGGGAPGVDGTAEWANPDLVTDLSSVSGISISDLRNYLALQRFQEARAKFGSRYSEYIKYLVPGIGNLDSRLQEPEYIGGGSATMSFSEILQTESSDASTALGTMAGHGISAIRTRPWTRFFPEHGMVMTLLSVVPKAIYAQQMNRKYFRTTKEEFFQKELQFIGEQPIYNKEVYAFHSEPDEVFGYNQRYDEYRYIPSSIHGDFTNSVANNWHYARIQSGDVALNNDFVECDPAVRPSADQSNDQLYVMANHTIAARRILAKYPTPRTF